MNRHLYLVGYRGTGKSTVGRLVAAALGRPFVDLDEQIEATAGTSIAGIFAAEGESGFREREMAVLRAFSNPPLSEAQSGDKTSDIIATGGGIVLREENREILRATGFVVWLQASAEAIGERIQADPATAARRPNLTTGGFAEIVELLARREPFYRALSDAIVPTDGRSPEAVADTILSLFRFSSPD